MLVCCVFGGFNMLKLPRLNYHKHQYCAVFLVVAQELRDFKTSTILVYMILNGKGELTGCMGTVLVPLFFNRLIQYSCLFLDKTFLLVSRIFVSLF